MLAHAPTSAHGLRHARVQYRKKPHRSVTLSRDNQDGKPATIRVRAPDVVAGIFEKQTVPLLAANDRYEGVPRWVQIDNLKTGVARGASPMVVLNRSNEVFARTCGFEIDPCRLGHGLGRRARLQAGRSVEPVAALAPDGTGQGGGRPPAGGLRADDGGAPMSAVRRKVDLDVVAERCRSLKLVHAAECPAELVEEASREDLSPVTFLDRVLEREIERKDERRLATSLRCRAIAAFGIPLLEIMSQEHPLLSPDMRRLR